MRAMRCKTEQPSKKVLGQYMEKARQTPRQRGTKGKKRASGGRKKSQEEKDWHKSLAGSSIQLPTKLLTISYSNSKVCKCCLCGSMSTDKNPLVQEADEAPHGPGPT